MERDRMNQQLNLLDMLCDEEYHIRQIEYSETKPFLLGVHYARRMPTIMFAYGLFKGVDLIGVCTYGMPASPSLCIGIGGYKYKDRVLELNRLAILPEYSGSDNLASRLVGQSLKMLPKGYYIVSYADYGGWGHIGYVYQATNWLYTGMTKARTDIYSESGHSRHYSKEETKRQVRTAKHRYIFIVAESKTKKKQMLKDMRYKIVSEYPKGLSRHYDTNNPIGLVDKEKPYGK